MKKLMRHNDILVPYVARWSSESDYFIRPDKYAEESPALFTRGMRGDGTPNFASLHPGRQRECQSLSLCALCGSKLVRRFTIDLAKDQQNRVGQPILLSPPMCATCWLYMFGNYREYYAPIIADPATKYLELLEWTLVRQWASSVNASSELGSLIERSGGNVCLYLLAVVEKANVYTHDNFVKELSGADVKQ